MKPSENSKEPTVIMTAIGKVEPTEEATLYVNDLDVFVTVMLLGDSPAVPSLGKVCEEMRESHEWKEGESPCSFS